MPVIINQSLRYSNSNQSKNQYIYNLQSCLTKKALYNNNINNDDNNDGKPCQHTFNLSDGVTLTLTTLIDKWSLRSAVQNQTPTALNAYYKRRRRRRKKQK